MLRGGGLRAMAATAANAAFATALLAGCSLIAGPSPLPSTGGTGLGSPEPAAAWNSLEVGKLLDAGAFEGPFDEVVSGVAYRDGFVLVGRRQKEDATWWGGLWLSPDGSTWTELADDLGLFEGMYVPIIGTDGERLVALGWGIPWAGGRRGPYVAWISDDGTRWQRADVEDTPLGTIYLNGIVGSPAAGFVAWGPKDDQHTGLLRSDDGLTWETLDYPGAAQDDITGVAPHGDGFIAVGGGHWDGQIGGPSEPARAWWSADGRSWVAVPVPGGWVLRGVFPGANGVYAVGSRECSRCVGPDLAWQSADGRSWRLLGDGPEHQGFFGTNGVQIAAYAWQDDRSISLSTDGVAWRKVVANLPAAEFDAGMVVGATGILLVQAQTPTGPDGVMDVHSGVLFMRGS